MVPVFGIVIMVLGRYLVFKYLDPLGVDLSTSGAAPSRTGW